MPDEITVQTPVLDDNGNPVKDKYGRPEVEDQTTCARVQRKTRTIYGDDRRQYQANLEIDLPPEFDPDYGAKVEGLKVNGETFSGVIKEKEDIISLFGNRVHYRTVFVDGR